MGVVDLRQCFQLGAQRVLREGRVLRLRQQCAHGAERPHRQRLRPGAAPVRGPELLAQPGAFHRHFGQRGGGHVGTGNAAGDAVGLVFVLPRQRKGLGRKARAIPVEEGVGGPTGDAAVVRQPVVQLGPRQAAAVNPGGKAAVVAAQVAVFVRQHGGQAARVERHQKRQADGEGIDGAAKQAEARVLLDAGVVVVVDQHAVDRRALDLGADALQQVEQRGGVVALQFMARGRLQPQPQRAQADPQQSARAHRRPDVDAAKAPAVRHAPGDAAQNGRAQQQAANHPGVAQRREQPHAAPIARAVFLAGLLRQAQQMHEFGAFHGATLPSFWMGCD